MHPVPRGSADARRKKRVCRKRRRSPRLLPVSAYPTGKEFERLFGDTSDTVKRLELARTQAMRNNIIIVLKDHHTVVATPEGECWYNLTGNAGMATAGAGDVLTGIITSLLAQKYEPHEAAVLGVYIHGLAGDYAAAQWGMEAMTASDIIENLGNAFKSITAS